MAPSTHEATLAFTLGKRLSGGGVRSAGDRLAAGRPGPRMADRALHGDARGACWLSPCGRSPARWWIRDACGRSPPSSARSRRCSTATTSGEGSRRSSPPRWSPPASASPRRRCPSAGCDPRFRLVIVAVALADSLSLSGIVWLVPALAAVAVGAWRGSSPPLRRAGRRGCGDRRLRGCARAGDGELRVAVSHRVHRRDRAREPDQARQSASACGGVARRGLQARPRAAAGLERR